MILTKNIYLKNFKDKKKSKKLSVNLNKIINKKNEILNSLSLNYKYSYSKNFIKKFIRLNKSITIIGMGGSILGMKAIYSFLKFKIKKNFLFIDNLNPIQKKEINTKNLNLIISKSGNTLETISNTNILIKKKQKNIFLTENTNNYLRNLALKLKAEIVDHNNFIGGRFSVLSEVGMLPASLAGLNDRKFKRFNSLIKNKKFLNSLLISVSNIFYFTQKKKFNSIIINYDESSDDLFKWYQQLVAESLGKKQKGILPIISTMPKDNHSLMQLYLDGPKNSFFTFFSVEEKNSDRIKSDMILKSHLYLRNKSINQILQSQISATEKVFNEKNLPFRSFKILKKSEETLGELFCFFILETILLGDVMKINPYNQPSVELIKKNTKKNLL